MSSSEEAAPPRHQPKDTAPTTTKATSTSTSLAARRGVPALSVAAEKPAATPSEAKGGLGGAVKTPHGPPAPLVTPRTAGTVSTAASLAGPPSTGPSRAAAATGASSSSSPETPWHIRQLPSTPLSSSGAATGGSVAPPSQIQPPLQSGVSPMAPSPSASASAGPHHRPYSEAVMQRYSPSQLRQQQVHYAQHEAACTAKPAGRKRPYQPSTGTSAPDDEQQPAQKRKRAASSPPKEDEGDKPSGRTSKFERKKGGEEGRSRKTRGGVAAEQSITKRGGDYDSSSSAPALSVARGGASSEPSEGEGEGEGGESDADAGARISSHRRRFGASSPPLPRHDAGGGGIGRPLGPLPAHSSSFSSSSSRRKARKHMGAPLHHYFPVVEQVVVQPHTELDVRRLPDHLQPSVHSTMMQSASSAEEERQASASAAVASSDSAALVVATPQRRKAGTAGIAPGAAEGGTPPPALADSAVAAVGGGGGAVSGGDSPEEAEAKRLKQSQTLDAVWWQRFEELRLYRETRGNSRVPQRYGKNPALGRWVARQRTERRMLVEGKPSTLTEEREKALEGIEFDWVVREK